MQGYGSMIVSSCGVLDPEMEDIIGGAVEVG